MTGPEMADLLAQLDDVCERFARAVELGAWWNADRLAGRAFAVADLIEGEWKS